MQDDLFLIRSFVATNLQHLVGSLRFAPDNPNPIPENGIVDKRRHDDSEIQSNDDSDIQMVDR